MDCQNSVGKSVKFSFTLQRECRGLCYLELLERIFMMIWKMQSGRTILEMIGALAIMAIMSVGGIVIYTMSLEKNKTNQFVDFVASSTNKISGFYRNYESSARTRTATDHLCKFSLIPENICKTATSGTTRTGYFGETLTPTVVIDKKDQTGSTSITDVDGNSLSIKRPYILYNIAVSGFSSTSGCNMIMTNPIWNKVGDYAYVTGLGDLGATQLPLSVNNASKCDDAFTITVVIDHYKN